MAAIRAQGSPKANISAYIRHDVNSRRSQPLLTYLQRCRPAEDGGLKSGRSYIEVFHDVQLSDGTKPPIPDEAQQLEEVLINLIDKGPGDKPVNGKSVSAPSNLLQVSQY